MFSVSGLVSEVGQARHRSARAQRPGAPASLWRFESPEVRRLGALLNDAAARIGRAGPLVFEARGVEPSQEPFVFLWAQFLRPDLELVSWRDLRRRRLEPSHWLVFGPRAEAPRPARRRFQLRNGVLFVLR